LFVACQCNHIEVVEELLDHNADLHMQMVDGASPLFISSQNGHLKMVKFLLSKAARPSMARKVCSHICFYGIFLHPSFGSIKESNNMIT